ncbi:hypothetical protein V8C26DRAFT_401632 [Trichoderma gracile]
MAWNLMQLALPTRKPTLHEAAATFLLLLPIFCSLVYRLYAKIRRRDGRSVGLQILSEASPDHEPKYEIIAVHGLGANPEHTWTCKTSSKAKGVKNQERVHLLKDLLMKDKRFADARILHFAYNSDWLVDACFESASDIGLRLKNSLIEHRERHARLPLIFIGHSFGGIIIKEALSANEEDTEKVLEDTHGIIFLGTPHLGSPIAGFGATIAYLTGFLGSDTGLLLSLRSNGELLRKLSEAFQDKLYQKKQDLGRETKIVSICEQKPTYLLDWLYAGKIVPSESATFGTNFMQVFNVDKDHSGLNKCPGLDDPLYKELTTQLRKLKPNAPPKINKVQQAVLECLRPVVASGAEYHPRFDEEGASRMECLPQTRVRLLDDICDWLDDFESSQKHLYWLQGKAGTGKSTIAHTVVSRMAKRKRIAASFFFKRGEGDRARLKRFFTTLSAQLVSKLPSLATTVQDALDSEPSLPEQDPRAQYRKLVQEPLQKQNLGPQKAIVVVVDALDECDSKEDLTILVHQLSQPIYYIDGKETSSKQLLVKYLLTSRLDHHTRSDFHWVSQEISEKTELERATSDTAKQDIERYLKTRLESIEGFLDPLPNMGRWSNPADVKILRKLTDRASPLFEFAAAACRFISQDTIPGGPKELVQDILKSQVYGDLGGVYIPIINRRFLDVPAQSRPKAKARFQEIIGSVIGLADSVTVPCLAQLIGQPESNVREELLLFQSVLVVPEEQDNLTPVSLFHESFRDFLLGPEANGEFKPDFGKTHNLLANRCIELLRASLTVNICHLKSPGTSRSEVDDETIRTSISEEVQYACRFWAYHLTRCGLYLSDGSDWFLFLKSRFLHWIEALSLLGRFSEIVPLIRELEAIIHPTEGTQIRDFLHDANRFVLYFAHIINTAPLQIYSSALTFSPTESVIRRSFVACLPKWITRAPIVEAQWSACLQTLEVHEDCVTSIAFSPEGFLASGDHCGHVNIWDTKSGTCLHTLHLGVECHRVDATTVAFSKTGKLGCFRLPFWALWDPSKGGSIQKSEDHGGPVMLGKKGCIATFTDEEKVVYVDRYRGEVVKWDLGPACGTNFTDVSGRIKPAGREIFDHEAISGRQSTSVSFRSQYVLSSDGQWLAWTNERKVELFHMGSNDRHSFEVLPPYGASIKYAFFSRDNRYFAICRETGDIQLRDVVSATILQIRRDGLGIPTTATISPDGRLLATGDDIGTIDIWDWKEVTRLRTTTEHGGEIRSLAFSPDGARLASASADRTVKVWDVSILMHDEESESAGSDMVSLAMNGQVFVTSTAGASAGHLWDSYGNKCAVLSFEGMKVCGIQVSANGNMCAAFSDDEIRLWDLETGGCFPVSINRQSIYSIALSADGGRLMTCTGYGAVEVWETRTGAKVLEYRERKIAPKIAISFNGKQVASLVEGRVRFEDLSEKTSFTWEVSTRSHAGLAFSPKGDRLAAAWNWEGAYIWDLTTGACIRRTVFDYTEFSTYRSNFVDPSFFDYGFTLSANLPEEVSFDQILVKYHVSQDRAWIMRHSEKLMWLPPAYRPRAAAAAGSHIVIARPRGRPYVIGLLDSGLDELDY